MVAKHIEANHMVADYLVADHISKCPAIVSYN